MNRKQISLSENLVLKVCAYFDGVDLTEADYHPAEETVGQQEFAKGLLSQRDKEYAGKSRILKVTQESMECFHCCPVHVNESLKPIMKTIKKQFPKIGQGNIGFGSVIYAKDPGVDVYTLEIVQAQKMLGGMANLARMYANPKYVELLYENTILPLITDQAALIALDDYILLKGIGSYLTREGELEAFLVKTGVGLEPLEISLVC